jgi:hypothetical protein
MYIDPNTGGMLFQILAVFFGLFSGFILFFSGKIRMTFARILRFFRKNREDEGLSAEAGDEPKDYSPAD